MGQRLTSLWLVLRKRTLEPPVLPKPDVNVDMLIVPGVNPNRQRKGKSGELPRRGGK
jgi:hypothetical protein